MGGDPTPGNQTPSVTEAPALRSELAPISITVPRAEEVKTVLWIAAVRPGKDDDEVFGPDNDFFVSATNDAWSDVGQWINECDAEQQYHVNWEEQLFLFVQRITELKRTSSDIQNLIGGVMLDWRPETHNICLNALQNLHINQWTSEAELISPHPYWPRPEELNCFVYENFAYTAERLRVLRIHSNLFLSIPNWHYEQFLTDISFPLLQTVCTLAPQFAILNQPIHIFQKIGLVVLNYVRNLRGDWFGGSRQLARSFRRWLLPIEPSPTVAIPRTPTQQAVAARFENPPEIYFLQGGHQQQITKHVMRKRDHGETRVDYRRRMDVIDAGRKRLEAWQIWRQDQE